MTSGLCGSTNDHDLCTGDGLCAEICPDIFFMHDDGLAYVKSVEDRTGLINGQPKHKMGGDDGLVDVPDNLFDLVVESAEECPG
jgi:ferredoxin